jgi:hypothetical protein
MLSNAVTALALTAGLIVLGLTVVVSVDSSALQALAQ